MWTENKALYEEEAESVALSQIQIQSQNRSLVAPKIEESKLVWYGGIKLAVEVESNTGDEVAVDDTMRAYSLTELKTEETNENYQSLHIMRGIGQSGNSLKVLFFQQ